MTAPWACARRAAKLPGTTASHSLCAHLGLARGRGMLEGGGDGVPHLPRKRCPGGEFPAETPSAWMWTRRRGVGWQPRLSCSNRTGGVRDTEPPKPAQQWLITADIGREAVCTAGKAKRSPSGSSRGGGIHNVLLRLPSTCEEPGQGVSSWGWGHVLGMGMSANAF